MKFQDQEQTILNAIVVLAQKQTITEDKIQRHLINLDYKLNGAMDGTFKLGLEYLDVKKRDKDYETEILGNLIN